MSLVIKTDDPHDHHVADSKTGEGYDRCGECDREVEQVYKLGGVDGKGEEYHMWSLFSCDRRDGGCGSAWSRTTEQGAERDRSRGQNPKWLTQSAAVGRSYHTGLSAEQYERVFGKK